MSSLNVQVVCGMHVQICALANSLPTPHLRPTFNFSSEESRQDASFFRPRIEPYGP